MRWSLVSCTLLLLPPGAAFADALSAACRTLQEQRDAVAREAMRAEIALATGYREQRCPELNRQAELANANSPMGAVVDYQALLLCRQAAEQQLERDNPVLYRNRLGFTFYSAAGAAAARRSDDLQQQINQQGCGVSSGRRSPSSSRR